ncbi:hypothetical protein D3C86_1244360 [compost metagenome]
MQLCFGPAGLTRALQHPIHESAGSADIDMGAWRDRPQSFSQHKLLLRRAIVQMEVHMRGHRLLVQPFFERHTCGRAGSVVQNEVRAPGRQMLGH